MTILVPYRGIIEIVSPHDVGKTLASLGVVYPYKKTVFVDDDVKGSATVKQLQDLGEEFALYVNMGKMRSELGETPNPVHLLKNIVYPTVDEIVKSAKGKKHEVIIWDTWRSVYQSARGYVERNQNEFKDVVTFRGSSIIIQGLISKVARMIEQTQINKLREVCELLIITHHLKDNYVNNVNVGQIPESSATFSEVSNMRIWLRRNPQSKVPIILFLKRPSVPVKKSGKIVFSNIVPMKIIPTSKDESIWDAIARYEKSPIESRMPTAEETPNAEEMAMINGTLTDEQKSYMLEMLKYQQIENEALGNIAQSSNGNYPKSKIELINMAQSQMGYDVDKVKEITGNDFTDLVRAWDKLKESKS